MSLKYVLEPGDTCYYPVLGDPSGQPMTIYGTRLMRTNGKIWAEYIIHGHAEDGTGLLDRVVGTIHANTDKAYDNLIIITGPEGSGKSNLAVQLCKMCDPTFTIEGRYIYDYLPFLKSLETDFDSGCQGRAYLMDEATNLASNRDWNQKDNKNFIQLLEMFRSRGLTLVMCIPSFDRLDVYIRQHRARMILECRDMPDGGKYSGRGFFKLILCQPRTRSVCLGTFDPMSAEDKEVYEKLKLESQRSKLSEMIEDATPEESKSSKKSNEQAKRFVEYFLNMGWGVQEISRTFDIPDRTIYRWRSEFELE